MGGAVEPKLPRGLWTVAGWQQVWVGGTNLKDPLQRRQGRPQGVLAPLVVPRFPGSSRGNTQRVAWVSSDLKQMLDS